MFVNADYALRVAILASQQPWLATPQGGVERIMLDRMGGERARATSLVRYAPAAHFPWHQHTGGEEILVLSGTFSDQGQIYPAGTYLRNPPGSSHQPSSSDGALLFVKLWQMAPDEHDALRIDTNGCLHGAILFSNDTEQVRLERLAPGQTLLPGHADGAELLVLAGELQEDTSCYPRHSWLRLPPGERMTLRAGKHGASVYLKTGHLAYLASQAAPC